MNCSGMISERRGGALILAVGYLAVMTLAAAGFLSMLHHHLSDVRKHEHAQLSRNIAEGGLVLALSELQTDAGYQGVRDVPLGEGRFSVAVTPSPAMGTYRVQVVGERLRGGVPAHKTVLLAEVVRLSSGAAVTIAWNPKEGP